VHQCHVSVVEQGSLRVVHTVCVCVYVPQTGDLEEEEWEHKLLQTC